jgi:membrane-associated phospholipid phosphatase
VRDAVALAAGIAGVVVSARIARGGLVEGEDEVFRVANDLPRAAFDAIWLPMQYGTFGTVPALAGLALVKGHRRLGVTIALGGTAAWIGAKAVKRVVGRERPRAILQDVQLRGQEEGDLGFPSGHAAVSAAITTAAFPSLPAPARAAAVALSAFVPFARMYVGAHLPLDLVGGTSLGIAVGSAAKLLIGLDGDGD